MTTIPMKTDTIRAYVGKWFEAKPKSDRPGVWKILGMVPTNTMGMVTAGIEMERDDGHRYVMSRRAFKYWISSAKRVNREQQHVG